MSVRAQVLVLYIIYYVLYVVYDGWYRWAVAFPSLGRGDDEPRSCYRSERDAPQASIPLTESTHILRVSLDDTPRDLTRLE